jgi:hypothetical protein
MRFHEPATLIDERKELLRVSDALSDGLNDSGHKSLGFPPYLRIIVIRSNPRGRGRVSWFKSEANEMISLEISSAERTAESVERGNAPGVDTMKESVK